MNQNIFQEFQSQKNRLIDIAAQAKVNGWITDEREKQIVDKINNDTLTIGVIGQMKCGKTTFLNAFVFGDTVLPSATTPMTAALSVITYGPEKKIEVEFYTHDEWAEQKIQASRNMDDVRGNEMEESKVKAAKELINKSVYIPGDINSYLGKTLEDSFDNLIQYVGADGKFISITKSVKIYYPHEFLKGVEIVDTPGFNDPIVSREERTKEFLHRADVVLLMLYAGRAFDTTDRTILFKNVRECGIGKILIGVNKYDIPYGNGETEQRIINTVKEQIEKACKTFGDESMVALVKEQDPILLSAEMSLMSQLPMERVYEEFETSWKNACYNFEISSQSQMAEKSRIDNLINAVKVIIERDKIEVLLKKPYNAIRGAALSKKEKIETELQQTVMLINNLKQPDDELEERLAKLKKANRKIERKLESLGDDIDLSFLNLIRKGRNEMEDEVDAACRKLDHEIDKLGRTADESNIENKWRSIMNILVDRTLKRCVERLADDAKIKLNSCLSEFCEEIENTLLKYIEDFEARDFIKKLSFTISQELYSKSIFSPTASSEEEMQDVELNFLEKVGIALMLPFIGVCGVGGYVGSKVGKAVFGNGDLKNELHKKVEDTRTSFDCESFLNGLKMRKPEIINLVRKKVMTDLLEPMQKQLEDILSSTQDKENRLISAIELQKNFEGKLNEINSAIDKIFSTKF